MLNEFSIADLAGFSGIKQHTIRIWEQRFSLLHPNRGNSSRRTYTAEELTLFLNVALLNQNGFKISNIDKMSMGEKLMIVSEITDQQQRAIHDLIIAMARMDCFQFQESLKSSLALWGVHGTVKEILAPFCHTTGLIPNSNTNKNYRENIHIITQHVRQVFYIALEAAEPAHIKNILVVLFQIPDDFIDDLQLLYLQYLLKAEGFSTINLGQVPADQLTMICKQIQPAVIVGHIKKTNSQQASVRALTEDLPKALPQIRFISLENQFGSVESGRLDHAPDIEGVIEIIRGLAV